MFSLTTAPSDSSVSPPTASLPSPLGCLHHPHSCPSPTVALQELLRDYGTLFTPYTQDKTQSPYGRPQAPRNLAPATTLTSPTPIRMTRPSEPFCHSSHHTVSFAYTFHFPAIPSFSSFGSLGGEACLPGHTHPPTSCVPSSHTFVHGVSLFVFLHVSVCLLTLEGTKTVCVLSSDVTAEPGT